MKYFLLLFMIITMDVVNGQSVTYYSHGAEAWQCITLVIPPKNNKAGKMFYTSSNSKIVETIKELKDIRTDTISASYITIGLSKQRYILVAPADAKYLILSDDKQITSTVFYSDSKMLNPDSVTTSPPSKSSVSQLLYYGAKLLKFML
ncbi:hypothetical protein ABIB62_002662 [Mucilaginibacter sp. UYP25]|uniref:hypothetical protein n=1 Tax=unclassified Mucilaginibacter TaxID=2617802 RepID=UPI0033932594